jgi:hypothetical protein
LWYCRFFSSKTKFPKICSFLKVLRCHFPSKFVLNFQICFQVHRLRNDVWMKEKFQRHNHQISQDNICVKLAAKTSGNIPISIATYGPHFERQIAGILQKRLYGLRHILYLHFFPNKINEISLFEYTYCAILLLCKITNKKHSYN